MKIGTNCLRTGAALAAIALGLSACTNADVARILAEGGEDFPEAYVGQVFPVYFASAEVDGEIGEGSDSMAEAGIGSATFVSPTQIRASIPGQPTRTYTQVGDTTEYRPDDFDDGGLPLFVVANEFVIVAANVDVEQFGGGFVAFAGFETPVENRPNEANYTNGDGVFFVGGEGFGGVNTVTCEDCVSLWADFINGDISGDLFMGSFEGGQGDFDVEVDLVEGEITEEGFTGSLDIAWDLTRFGSEETEEVALGLSNQTVIGRFFGPDADVAAVVYETDADIDLNGEEPGSFAATFSGASGGERVVNED